MNIDSTQHEQSSYEADDDRIIHDFHIEIQKLIYRPACVLHHLQHRKPFALFYSIAQNQRDEATYENNSGPSIPSQPARVLHPVLGK